MKNVYSIGLAILIFGMFSCSDKSNDPNPETPSNSKLKELQYFEPTDNINFRTTSFYYNPDGSLDYIIDKYKDYNEGDYDSTYFSYDPMGRLLSYSVVIVKKDGLEDESYGSDYIYIDADVRIDSSYSTTNGVRNKSSGKGFSYSGNEDSVHVVINSGTQWHSDRIYQNGNLVKYTSFLEGANDTFSETIYEYDIFNNPFSQMHFLGFGSGEQAPKMLPNEPPYTNNITKTTRSYRGDISTLVQSYEYNERNITAIQYYDDNYEDEVKVLVIYN